MLYLAATSSHIEHLAHDQVGIMTSPRARSVHGIHAGRPWGMDCDVFSGPGYNEDAHLAFIERLTPMHATCLFMVVPDVPGDGAATRVLWEHGLPLYAITGLPLAYVMHDGCEQEDLPEEADVMFLGGTDPWREAWGAVMLQRAADLGKRTHVGRVNSRRRVTNLALLHADSCDGTYLAFQGRDTGLARIGGWLDAANTALFRPEDFTPTPIRRTLLKGHAATWGKGVRPAPRGPDMRGQPLLLPWPAGPATDGEDLAPAQAA
jgi:hypothetical protein